MGYQWRLCTQWSRRDRLTIVIIGVATAFLVGTTLLLVAVNTQTAAISSGFNNSMVVTHYDSMTAANAAATSDDIVLPLAAVHRNGTTGVHRNGTTGYVVGVPAGTPTVLQKVSVTWREARFPPPPSNATLAGPVGDLTRQRFVGSDRTETLSVSPPLAKKSVFPHSWYIAKPATVRSLGTTGAYVVDTTYAPHTGNRLRSGTRGVVTPGLYRYFIAGMQSVVSLLGLVVLGGGVLVLVVVYNVTRMSVRNRLETIEVVRATGGTPRSLLAIFAVRAGLLTAVGIALGYAFGVIVTSAVVNAAVVVGLRISLAPTVSPAVLQIIVPGLAVLLIAGIGAGVLAVRPATTTPPSRLRQEYSPVSKPDRTENRWLKRLRTVVDTTVLRWRAVIPAATILTIFVLVVLIVGSLVGVLSPLATTSSGTITEPGAPYPMASRIDAGYADLLRRQGVMASPEIIVVQVRNGQPYLARGANWRSFAAVSNATLVAGGPPKNKYDAVIGRDLARTLDLGIGDSITLGGASSPAFTQVTITGVFRANGIQDDQLIVPLPTAHDLSTNPGTVQFIRTKGATARLSRSQSNAPDIVVSSVSAPNTAVRGNQVPVRIAVRNVRSAPRTRTLTARLGSVSKSRSVTLSGGEERTVTVNVPASSLGNRTLRVGSYTQSMAVYRHSPLSVPILPSQAPPNETMAVPVRAANGANVSGATVRVGNHTAETGENGLALVRLPSREGTYNLTVEKGNRANTSSIHVVSGATRSPIGTVTISPQDVNSVSHPTASIVLFNPWSRSITRNISFVTPTKTVSREVTLPPHTPVGMTRTVGKRGSYSQNSTPDSNDMLSPGNYSVRVVADGRTIGRDSFTVHGDSRTFSTLARNTHYASGSGIGGAVRGVFGNFNLLLLVMVLLAGLTAVGGTTATFAQAVHARRRAVGVYRATGANRLQLVRILLADACRLSIPAIVIAVVAALLTIRLLAIVGLFTVFGVRLSPRIPLPILLLAVGSALVLMGLSVLIAAIPYLVAEPTTVQRGTSNRPEESRRERL